MRLAPTIALAGVLLGLSACANVPQEAITLNDRVTKGIEMQRDNTLTILEAYRKTLHDSIKEKRSEVYKDAESDYRAKKNLGSAPLTAAQQEDVATVYLIRMNKRFKKVDDAVDGIIAQTKDNANLLVKSNDSLSHLLSSVNELLGQQNAVVDSIGSMTGVDFDSLSKAAQLAARGAIVLDNATNPE